MKKNLILVAFVWLSLGLFSVAYAQEEGGEVPADSGSEAPSGPTNYNFDDDLVTGDLVRPDGELLNVRRRGRRSSLIRIREDFTPEMLKSVETL
ncbi:MAG: hypothetical protein IPJ88_11400 [Myxococcales bacterium]|nr:MAG: hypothetical protein IPJ88_11400 [Myxococcales bacterium]